MNGGIKMKQSKDLERLLKSLDGQKYGAYKRMKGIYQFDQFRLAIDHVQVDPFAPPSKMRVIIGKHETEIPSDFRLFNSNSGYPVKTFQSYSERFG